MLFFERRLTFLLAFKSPHITVWHKPAGGRLAKVRTDDKRMLFLMALEEVAPGAL